jgi:hypothetical protein
VIAVAGQAVAVVLMVYVHVAFGAEISAVSRVVSDYALLERSAGPYAGSLLALAIGVAALTAGLLGQRLGRTGPALLGLSSCAMVLAVAFPTDPIDLTGGGSGESTLSGQIHRYATAIAFVGLPGAGWALARRPAAVAGTPAATRSAPAADTGIAAVGWITVGCWVSLGAFLVSHIPVSFPGTPIAGLFGDHVFYGLTERIVLLFEGALLVALSTWLVRRSRRRPERV